MKNMYDAMDHTENKAVCDVIIVQKAHTKKFKSSLEDYEIFNKKFRIKQIDDEKFAIPIYKDKFEAHESKNHFTSGQFISSQILMPFSKAHLTSLKVLQKSLTEAILDEFYKKTNKSLEDEYMKEIPKSWHIYGDMLVLPKDSMQGKIWNAMGPSIWEVFCKVFDVCRVARHSVISDDPFRSSKAELLYGDSGLIRRKDNGIFYEYDITKCMFSDGNITEKIRIANMDCTNEVIVDLFAGIGYFVLPFLVHAKAEFVYACEWNSSAIEALKRNLEINGVNKRCVVLEGDNRKVAPKGVADRVNLGLIPSSESSWQTACECLKPLSGGWLHIHANVNSLSLEGKRDDDKEKVCHENASEAGFTEKRLALDQAKGEDVDHSETKCSRTVENVVQECNDSSSLPEIFNGDKMRGDDREGARKEVSKTANKRDVWGKWAANQALNIQGLLEIIHKRENAGEKWTCYVRHIEHVKSYAPHIDHIVVDMECRPVTMT